MIWVQPHPGHVVAKTFYNDYLSLMAGREFKEILRNSYAGADSSKHDVVIRMKSARFVQ